MKQEPGKLQFRSQVLNSDRESVRQIALSSGYFREDEVSVAVELVDEVLAKGEESGYHFIFALLDNHPVGFACFGSIPCTIGSYDLYWIAVDEHYRGRGIGKQILSEVEQFVNALYGRQIFIETSSTPKYEPTRIFYFHAGYGEVARLPDFYLEGDDKVVYMKKLR